MKRNEVRAGRSVAYDAITEVAREGVVPLTPPTADAATRKQLHIATVIPPFRRGSGGHNTIFELVRRLERMGHSCTVWVHFDRRHTAKTWPAFHRRNIRDWFGETDAPVFEGFEGWHGADIVIATGWQTVYPVLRLDGCRARAYLVQDHEPEFYPTSAESLWAEQTFSYDLPCIAASAWLRDLLIDRYGAQATAFELGVDHNIYAPQEVARTDDTVIFYGRDTTPRRAVPLGTLALHELKRMRPQTQIEIFGDADQVETTFAYRHLGVVSPSELASAYSAATVGLCLSLTNYSLIPQEMLACGLPCVDLAGRCSAAVFGVDGPVELAQPDPVAIAAALARLLDDPTLWQKRSTAGIEFVQSRTWDTAAESVERDLRGILDARLLSAVG